MRGMVAKSARKQVTNRVYQQGIGRQPRTEVVGSCIKMVDALSVQLGEGKYFFGDKPTTYDATAYAFTAGVLCPAFDNELRRHSATKKNLVSYAERLKDQYWKD